MKNPLLLLHGALGSKDQFAGFKEKLGGFDEVYDFNFSGHGGQIIPDSFSIDLFAEDTLDFMDRHQILAVDIFGYSMGGYVALQLAHDFPDRVNRIITLGTKFKWTPESAAKEVRMMNPEVIEHKVPAFAEILAERHTPEDWKKIMNLTAEMMTGLGDGHAMTTEEFRSIGHPVLICLGSEDHMVTREESENIAMQLKNGTFKIIEGFKHPFESIDRVILARHILGFLNRVE